MKDYTFKCSKCDGTITIQAKNYLDALDKLIDEYGWKAMIGAAICPGHK